MKRSKVIFSILALIVTTVLLFGSGGVINVLSTNQVSNNGLARRRWEPSSAVGSETWVTGFTELDAFALTDSYVSAWKNGGWTPQVLLRTPTGLPTGDVYLEWDSFRNRFVLVVIDLFGPPSNIWYAFSNDAKGTSWTWRSTPVFATGAGVGWDFPSIGVDGSGRIIVGAVQTPGDKGFYTKVSTDGGTTFSTAVKIPTVPGPNEEKGLRSRIVATNNQFHAFIPTLTLQQSQLLLPIAVERFQSSDGTTWSGSTLISGMGPPKNNSENSFCGSQGCGQIFYAPLLDARGSPNGRWTMAIQMNNGGFNNVYICTSDRGCGIVNSFASDQFMAGTSVDANGGYWVAYNTYSSDLSLPLITQAIYFPPGQAGIGATTNTNIYPTSWSLFPDGRRCELKCFGAGDYAGIASNPFAAASTPFVKQSPLQTDLLQSFVQDPAGTPNVPNFEPNFIPFERGANLSHLARPLPAQTGGLPAERTVGVPSIRPSGLDRVQ